MPCLEQRDETGRVVGIVCVRGARRQKPCSCGRPAVALCDWPVERPAFGRLTVATCDEPLCRDHRVNAGPGIDYCIAHSLEAPR